MPTSLKLMSRYGHALYDATWIAGVDYDEELFEDDDYKNDSDMSDKNSDEDSDDDDLGEDFDEMDRDEITGLVQETIEEPNENNASDVNSAVNITADSDNSENGAEGNESENNDNQSVGGVEEEQDEDDNEGNKPELNEEQPTLLRSQRTTKMPERFASGDYQMHLHAQSVKPTFYDVEDEP